MAPSMVIETSRFILTAEYIIREVPGLMDEKHKPVTTLHVAVARKSFARRLREALSNRDTRVRDKNVTETNGQIYGKMPDPFEYYQDEKAERQMLTVRLFHLKVQMVARMPDIFSFSSPKLAIDMEKPHGNFRITGVRGNRLI